MSSDDNLGFFRPAPKLTMYLRIALLDYLQSVQQQVQSLLWRETADEERISVGIGRANWLTRAERRQRGWLNSRRTQGGQASFRDAVIESSAMA